MAENQLAMASFGGLVDYSDDSSGAEDSEQQTERKDVSRKRASSASPKEDKSFSKKPKLSDNDNRSLPPVPSDILNMFAETKSQSLSEDSTRHQGRMRTFAHEAGNWASLVYVPLRVSSEVQQLVSSMIKILQPAGEFVASDDFHLSLSKTFVLKHHWIESFVESLQETMLTVEQLTVELSSTQLLTNDEKIRTFVVLRTHCASSQLKELVKRVDSCLAEFRLPQYYREPSFHVSVCWALGDLTTTVKQPILDELQTLVDDFVTENGSPLSLPVSHLVCKTGNKFFNIPLKPAR